MADQAETRVLDSLRDAVHHFAAKTKQLAAPMLQPFGRSSAPVALDACELRKLRARLERIRATLGDAEGLAAASAYVRLWLRELGDLEYRADDVLEALEYEAHRAARLEAFKVELTRAAATGKRKREAAVLFSASPPDRLRRKVAEIWERYRDVSADREALRLGPGDGECRATPPVLAPTSSFPKCQLHGRDRDMAKVIELLRHAESSSDGCSYAVVPIVGMAGVGKTTLAQHVCRDEVVASKFDMTLWVWVSQEFDVARVTAKILEEITKSRPDCSELNTLQGVIIDHLKGKRCLIVLDDVWDESRSNWDLLMAPLCRCAMGSRVIVTTRSMAVAKMVSPKPYHLRGLSDASCWLVCKGRALHGCNGRVDQELTEIGRKIATKCKGLPLAAEAAGSALSISISEEHWNEVLESYLWTDGKVAGHILPALKVSYDHLPRPLKRCFAFCSLFPKGFVFQKDVLVQLWIAEGFVDIKKESLPEGIGGVYFDGLVSRCFFQPSRSHHNGEGKFVMHDLYQELAQFVSGSEYSRTEDHKLMKLDEKTRHSSLVPEESQYEKEIQLGSFAGRDLRTFLFIGRMEWESGEIPFKMKMPHEIVLVFECLRALDLSNTDIKEVPKSVGTLIHLRYLGLENTRIESLPESISALFQLQTIKVRCCSSLALLPRGTKLLMNLRHLELPHSNICMPSGIGLLAGLQTLPIFVVGNDSAGCGIQELNKLVNLRGDLHILGLNNVYTAQAAKAAAVANKERLKKLTLEWSGVHVKSAEPGLHDCCKPDTMSSDPEVNLATKVLECLMPHSNLEELIIKGFNGVRFPTWLGGWYLNRLVSIELKNCQECEQLPPLGFLPSLKHVLIQSMASVKHVGREFCGNVGDIACSSSSKVCSGFPTLETLKFREMHAWEEWSGVQDGDFPQLKYLTISRCCNLRALPQFNSEIKLRIHGCEQLLSCLSVSGGRKFGVW